MELWGYQQEARDFLLSKETGILGDVPGLGKTFPAIDAAQKKAPTTRKLVVAPSYLLQQWKGQIERWVPFADVRVVARNAPVVEPAFTGWVIVNYHTLMDAGIKAHPELLGYRWGVVIFDEAHRLRGRKSQWTKNAWRLRADAVWLLTGTPIVNNPGDMWPYLKLLDRTNFTSYWRFVGEWCVTEQNPWTTVIHGVQPEKEDAFNTLLAKYMLRRTVDAAVQEELARTGTIPVWTQKPEVVPVVFTMPPSMRKAHDVAKREWFIAHPDLDDPVAIKNGGALVAKLRQLTAGFVVEDGEVVGTLSDNPKIKTVCDILEDNLTEPVIVFCWYRGTADLLVTTLRKKFDGRAVYSIDGGTSAKEREARLAEWEATTNGVIVATLAALTEGANLQHSRTIVFAEHDYLPSTLEQAIARAKRFGQQSIVRVYHIMAERSIDTAVYATAQTRERNIKRALLENLRD